MNRCSRARRASRRHSRPVTVTLLDTLHARPIKQAFPAIMDDLLLEVNPVQEGVIVQLDLGFEGYKALELDGTNIIC